MSYQPKKSSPQRKMRKKTVLLWYTHQTRMRGRSQERHKRDSKDKEKLHLFSKADETH